VALADVPGIPHAGATEPSVNGLLGKAVADIRTLGQWEGSSDSEAEAEAEAEI
jgi:hypothetical protein